MADKKDKKPQKRQVNLKPQKVKKTLRITRVG